MSIIGKAILSAAMLAFAVANASAKDKEQVAVIKTNRGDIVMTFDKKDAPKHVENFIKLAKSGFYDGLTFHRVEPGFVIQGGDPAGNGTGGPSEAALKKAYGTIPDYIMQRGGGYTLPAEIGAPHVDGAVAMARTNNPEKRSSTSQFYICLGPQHFLDGNYTVFGQVIEGMDVVKNIQRGDKMLSVTIEDR
jgi:peptidyl-prolyl cis-trans isomerase B (cyclophilin B)